jgi:hypothetical protein
MNEKIVYDFGDAVYYILERCDISRDIIERVLLLEEEYMASIGIMDKIEEFYEDEEDDSEDEDEEFYEENKKFDCYFGIDCEDCGYYVDHEGTCPFKTSLFIN